MTEPQVKIATFVLIIKQLMTYIEAMTPEEKARVKIDKLFQEAGWSVVSREQYTPALTAAAIREGLLEKNLRADYFLFINGKAVGVLEAKRAEMIADIKAKSENIYNAVAELEKLLANIEEE